MTSSRYARGSKDAPRAAGAPPPSPGRRLRVLTLLLALYAAGAATMALMRGGGSESKAAVPTPGTDSWNAALDEQARRIRGEVKEDVAKERHVSEERVARAVKQVEDARDGWKAAVEPGVKRADDVVRNAAVRADEMDGKIEDVQRTTSEMRAGVDGLRLAVKELQARPVGVAPASSPSAGPVKPGEPPPDKPPAASGEPAAPAGITKEAVREKIADLSNPETKKVYSAAVFLGKAGDLEAAEPLAKLVREHKDYMVRMTAATALGQLKACDAVPTLLGAFLDKQASVFLAAAQAFAQITGFDAGLAGDSRLRSREDAKSKALQYWAAHEAEIREKLGQPKSASAPSEGGSGGSGGGDSK